MQQTLSWSLSWRCSLSDGPVRWLRPGLLSESRSRITNISCKNQKRHRAASSAVEAKPKKLKSNQSEDFPDAKLDCGMAEQDPKLQAEGIKAEGNAKLASKDFASAEELYSRAIDLCPENETYYTNRALARTNLKKFDSAAEDCYAALKINPGSARAYGRLGSAMFQAGKFSESRDAYVKALDLDKGNATYTQGLQAAEAKLKPVLTSGLEDTAGAIAKVLASAAATENKAPAVSVNNKHADMGVGLGRSMRAKQVRIYFFLRTTVKYLIFWWICVRGKDF